MLTIMTIDFLIVLAELWQLTKQCNMNFSNRLTRLFIYQTLFTLEAFISWVIQQFANVSFNENKIFTYFSKLL